MTNPFLLGDRERARLAWRAEVARAAMRFQRERVARLPAGGVAVFNRRGAFRIAGWVTWDVWIGLIYALAAPRPWTSGGQRRQPKRLSRAARRARKTALVRRWMAEREREERVTRQVSDALRRGEN